jgi:hypothetical protein
MPSRARQKTKYPGVYFVEAKALGSQKTERVYFIQYRKNGKLIEEKAGRQFKDNMTPAKAAGIRTQRIEGASPTNQERRLEILEQKKAEEDKWTVDRLWEEYKGQKPDNKAIRTDTNRYEKYLKPRFGDLEPQDIVHLEIDRLRIGLRKTVSRQTAKHILALLNRQFRCPEGTLCPPPLHHRDAQGPQLEDRGSLPGAVDPALRSHRGGQARTSRPHDEDGPVHRIASG